METRHKCKRPMNGNEGGGYYPTLRLDMSSLYVWPALINMQGIEIRAIIQKPNWGNKRVYIHTYWAWDSSRKLDYGI